MLSSRQALTGRCITQVALSTVMRGIPHFPIWRYQYAYEAANTLAAYHALQSRPRLQYPVDNGFKVNELPCTPIAGITTLAYGVWCVL